MKLKFFNKDDKKSKSDSNKKIPLENNFYQLIKKVEDIYSYPLNKEIIKREIKIPFFEREAVLFYLETMVDGDKIERTIIHPLIDNSIQKQAISKERVHSILTAQNITEITTLNDLIDQMNVGKTVLLIDGISVAFVMDTTGYAHRSVERAQNESVIKGPQESFVESSSINRSLIRKQIKDENLITETITVGKRSKNDVTLMYIKDIANPSLVESVRARIKEIDVDMIQNLEILEQFIDERSFSIVPPVLYTERPDRTAAYITEGHVAMFMDDSSTSIIVPVTYWSLLHSAEDSYLRFFYGNFVRLIRFIATFIALLVPAIYLAITEFHSEMIPADLLLAIAGTREKVPFPAFFELLFMELAFEILREAGIRIPNPIGPTIGIVGALILGQAAVDANVVSPIMVIVVSITGLASFAIPDISLSYMIRILRFAFTFAAAFMGIFGIVVVMAIVFGYMSGYTSFNVPFFSPVTPYYKSSNDTLFRLPPWMEIFRPGFLKTKDTKRREETKKGYKP